MLLSNLHHYSISQTILDISLGSPRGQAPFLFFFGGKTTKQMEKHFDYRSPLRKVRQGYQFIIKVSFWGRKGVSRFAAWRKELATKWKCCSLLRSGNVLSNELPEAPLFAPFFGQLNYSFNCNFKHSPIHLHSFGGKLCKKPTNKQKSKSSSCGTHTQLFWAHTDTPEKPEIHKHTHRLSSIEAEA